jgi:uncharacterized protein YkwD
MRATNLPVIRQYPKIAIGIFALAGAFLFAGSASSALACPNTGAAPANMTAEQAEQSVTCLVNKARRKNHARPLVWNASLQSAARSHSAAMDASNFFAHGDSLGRIKAAGYLGGASFWAVGENIHWGAGGQGSPRATVRRWMRSPAHRSAMLSRQFRNIGVGVAMGSPMGSGGGNTAIYTADFGRSG